LKVEIGIPGTPIRREAELRRRKRGENGTTPRPRHSDYLKGIVVESKKRRKRKVKKDTRRGSPFWLGTHRGARCGRDCRLQPGTAPAVAGESRPMSTALSTYNQPDRKRGKVFGKNWKILVPVFLGRVQSIGGSKIRKEKGRAKQQLASKNFLGGKRKGHTGDSSLK